ncbi:MAG: MCE family protein [Mycolicibacter algericus]|uniref:MCE family protein n=1 Tax=Mycolicibacter algericus TaxID=1288388 RepID=UPI003C7101F3
MRANLSGIVWRLGIFVLVTVFAMCALVTIFGQVRFEGGWTYRAEFIDAAGLENGNFVRIAGVEVGKVTSMSLKDDGHVTVDFTADESVALTEGSRAVIRWDNVIGGRYLALEQGAGGVKLLKAGETIPVDRTAPALDLDALIGGFRPLFRALDPDQVNKLTGQLIAAFQGQGTTIGSFLVQTSALTSTLADQDALIGEVIGNLSAVLGSLSNNSGQFALAVDSLSELVHGLAERKQEISDGVTYVNASARSIGELMSQSRPPLQKAVGEVDRTAEIVLGDHEYVEGLLDSLPDTYRMLLRQGLNGNYFSFYLCDLVLKMNGKGGQPVYVKLAGQSTGRCAPK